MLRLFLFIALSLIVIHLPMWLFLPLAVLYVFLYRGYELFLLSVCIDAYYGFAVLIPYYTLAVLLLILVIETSRPAIRFKGFV